MKRITILLATILLPLGAVAEDVLMEGGRSPNGKIEVRIVKAENPDPYEKKIPYRIEFRSTHRDKVIFQDEGAGYYDYRYAPEYCHALWAPSGRYVAFVERETRHTTKLSIFGIKTSRVKRLKLPEYVGSALRRVNATEIDFALSYDLKRWDGDNLIFGLNFTANNRILYQCDVTVQFDRAMKKARLKKVTQPIGLEGG